MSRCISINGEFSDHVYDGETLGSEFNCARCFAYDEEAADAEIGRLREALTAERSNVENVTGKLTTERARVQRVEALLKDRGRYRNEFRQVAVGDVRAALDDTEGEWR